MYGCRPLAVEKLQIFMPNVAMLCKECRHVYDSGCIALLFGMYLVYSVVSYVVSKGRREVVS